MKTTQRLQSGFTLMEAMIALLIFSVGLLGLAGMQMSGLQNNHNSLMRTLAIQEAYDMADRLRSKASAPTAVAETYWNGGLAERLPSGQGTVTATTIKDETNDFETAAYIVTVFWDEDRTGATEKTNCPPTSDKDLRCVRITVIP